MTPSSMSSLAAFGRDPEPEHLVDGELHAGRTAGLDHPVALVDRDRHRLLGVDVLAGCGGRAGLREVRGMRRAEDHRVDVVAGEQGLDRRLGLCVELLRERRRAPAAGDRDELAVGDLADVQPGRIATVDVARADQPEPDLRHRESPPRRHAESSDAETPEARPGSPGGRSRRPPGRVAIGRGSRRRSELRYELR